MPIKKEKALNKLSDQEQVAKFIENLKHPLKLEIECVRRIILEANDHLLEHIKWNAPCTKLFFE
ncbi:hypothetical protein [Paenibacillus lemnae]|uniref:hypothetical protein n=1 Tax=Paenibacillus lemnae TaxID=1330551 RepID=UPI001FEB65A6|nr:hypothetical protein [Paenibacillus lemnae]